MAVGCCLAVNASEFAMRVLGTLVRLLVCHHEHDCKRGQDASEGKTARI